MTTNPLRAVIVDDEPLARRGIRARLEGAGIEIVEECESGSEAVRAIRDVQPDLVFLDIQMPEMDGFQVIDAIGVDAMPALVFVTAHDRHALRAFDAHAVDYVLKPIDDERFQRALDRVRAQIAERRDGMLGRRLRAVLADAGHAATGEIGDAAQAALPARIAVHDRGRIVLLDPADIVWVGAEGDYVRIYAGGRGYLARGPLSSMEQRLDPSRFARIHRSAIVGLAGIRELTPQPNREYVVLLHDGTKLRSSRRYADRMRALVGDVV